MISSLTIREHFSLVGDQVIIAARYRSSHEISRRIITTKINLLMKEKNIIKISMILIVVMGLLSCTVNNNPLPSPPTPDKKIKSSYVGTKKCAECHPDKHEGWKRSFHSRAMEEASPQTVLGAFGKVDFNHDGTKAEMYSK